MVAANPYEWAIRSAPPCYRCGRDAWSPNSYEWQERWPVFGSIDVGREAQVFAKLRGRKFIAEREDFEWWKSRKTDPIFTRNEAQRVTLEWNNGGASRASNAAHLCRECQDDFLRMLGEFFHWTAAR